jgi:hypothetical protein
MLEPEPSVHASPPHSCAQVLLLRYYIADDWTPRKLEVEVEVPDTLDLTGGGRVSAPLLWVPFDWAPLMHR